MNVLIIEDEAPAARRLEQLIKDYNSSVSIVGVIESITAAVRWLKEHESPDLIFMDIQLADGISFEIFRQMEVKTPVIFTTAYDQYTLQAFKVNSIGYLLKPISQDELNESMRKYNDLKELFNQTKPGMLQALLNSIQQGQKVYKSRFLVKLGDRLIFIFTEQIAYFMAEDKLVFIISNEGKKYNTDFSLDDLENLLSPQFFFRINRQFITHIQSIRNIHNYFNGKLKLNLHPEPAQDVIVSRERAALFKKWLDQ
jgi:two-component system LytT family response regulator